MDIKENVEPQMENDVNVDQNISEIATIDSIDAVNDDELSEIAELKNATSAYATLSETELVAKANELVQHPNGSYKDLKGDILAIKQLFYKIINQNKEEAKEAFVAEGGNAEDFVAAENPNEAAFKAVLSEYKEKKLSELQHEEKIKADNLAKKKDLLLRLKELIDNPEDFGKKVPAFSALKEEWMSIGPVTSSEVSKMRENFSVLVETFYDNLKINNELREYDFKKNLEAKTKICEEAEALSEVSDVVSAFKQLQKLHEEWSNLGPVAKDLRESIWLRFKSASTLINKKHNDYFDQLRAAAMANYEKKSAICEKIESIKTNEISSLKEWQDKSEEVKTLQSEWKTIGFAPKKFNNSIYLRFREACDAFFNAKNEFVKSAKSVMADNLAKKISLCEQAEALKDSTDWKNTAEKLVELQKEWKTIGPLAKKQSDAVWTRFVSACDAFFNAKKKDFDAKKSESKARASEEHKNLAAKREIIEQIQILDVTANLEEAQTKLSQLKADFMAIGHVPFKLKDEVYDAYRHALEEKEDALHIKVKNASKKTNNRQNHKNVDPMTELLKKKQNLEAEVLTYENNMGFLASSKAASSLKNEIEKRIADKKAQIAEINEKIKAARAEQNS
ncbi:MAG: DUF349 domain-containing protein [Bacteroidales bacterium]|nr:DUF349 domain-containing protein [Candidatus Physcocola equi]